MQLSLPWRYGTAVPFTSTPRINWYHPLARGLVFCGYGYPSIDLVKGRAAVLNSGASALPAQKTSPKGQGPYFSSSNSNSTVWPADYLPSTFAQSGPFSCFVSMFQVGSPGAGNPQDYFCLTNGATSEVFDLNVDGSGVLGITVGGVTAIRATTLTTKTYYVIGAVIVGASSVTLYNNGKVAGTGTWPYATPGAGQLVTLAARDSGGNGWGVDGIIFSSMIWGRALSATEVTQLTFDPYSFLWYPEDDIFATLVGVTGPAPPSSFVFSTIEQTTWYKTDVEAY
jgi:hypothetical protein